MRTKQVVFFFQFQENFKEKHFILVASRSISMSLCDSYFMTQFNIKQSRANQDSVESKNSSFSNQSLMSLIPYKEI